MDRHYPRPKHPDEIQSFALSMYSEGFSTQDLQEVLGIPAITTWQWMKDAGINRSRSEASLLFRQSKGIDGCVMSNGYKRITRNGKEQLEHRWVMEQMLGRALQPGESVHHKNGNRLDNNPQNLELWVVRQPRGQRVEDRIQDALELLATYSGEFL